MGNKIIQLYGWEVYEFPWGSAVREQRTKKWTKLFLKPDGQEVYLNVRKYTRAKKLTPRMLSELIERIEVHQAEKVDGVHVQKLTIHYNCVGSIEIPGILPLPEPDVLIRTRKGVAISYSPSLKAV